MIHQIATTAMAGLIGLCVLCGCESKDDSGPEASSQTTVAPESHDPNDFPLTEDEKEAIRNSITDYPDAVSRIRSYRDTIRDAIAAGDPPTAHRPLDELDVVLEHLTSVARDSDVPRRDWETVNTAAQQLRASFNKVHAQIDAGEAPDYETVAAGVEESLNQLQGVSPAGS